MSWSPTMAVALGGAQGALPHYGAYYCMRLFSKMFSIAQGMLKVAPL
jgi:hypothetical protein